MGQNGQSLSDRELTDNEGPPRHVPRTNPRLPRRPSGSRSSGDDSDSGRSRASDGRYRPAMGVRGSTPTQPGSPRVQPVPHVMSAPGSPTLAKLAQRVGHKMKDGSPSHWPEKVSVSKHARAKAMEKGSEQWVDGPGAAIYPEKKKSSEQWVDGPPAFRVQNEAPATPPTAPSHAHSHAGSNHSTPQSPRHGDTARRMKNSRGKVEAEEQWVDGPREMMAGSNPNSSSQQSTSGCSATPLHTTSKNEPLCRAVIGQPNQAPKLSVAVNEKALKQALIKHLESKDNKEGPESTISTDSNFSTAVEAADSRPQSLHSTGSEGKDIVSSSPSHQRKSEFDSSKRQAADGVSLVGDLQQVEESDHSHHHHHHHHSHVPASPRKQHRKMHVAALASPKHSPRASPASPRKGDPKSSPRSLQKSDLPGSAASPTHRVAQWIKSVSETDQMTTTTSSTPLNTQACIDSEEEEENVTQPLLSVHEELEDIIEVSENEMATAADVIMADAETNTGPEVE